MAKYNGKMKMKPKMKKKVGKMKNSDEMSRKEKKSMAKWMRKAKKGKM